MGTSARGWVPAWVGAVTGPPGARVWLLDLELAWYLLTLALIVVGRPGVPPPTSRTEYSVMLVLAVLCALAALTRWWRPEWSGPIAVGVLALGVGVLAVRPLGSLGPLRLMLSAAVVPVLLVGAARRARPWTVLAVIVLACAGAWLDATHGGNTLSIELAVRLIHDERPSFALRLLTAILLLVLPVAFGLVLRSTDTARRAEFLARVRAEERLGVARELHDMVANHVTGIVVAAQAAGLARDLPDPTARALVAIEDAGNRALGAMARMVGALRAGRAPGLDGDPATGIGGRPVRPTTAPAAVRAAVGDDPRVRVHVGDGVRDTPDEREMAADVVMTVHRIVVESLTNARRHTPPGARIDVALCAPGPSTLTLEITNDRVRGPARPVVGGGYGLVGLVERAAAVGGRLEAGPTADGRWRVHAELPC